MLDTRWPVKDTEERGCVREGRFELESGTVSNEKVDINNIVETNIIVKKTLNSVLKKKGKLLFALFLSRTLFMLKNVL